MIEKKKMEEIKGDEKPKTKTLEKKPKGLREWIKGFLKMLRKMEKKGETEKTIVKEKKLSPNLKAKYGYKIKIGLNPNKKHGSEK